MMTVLDVERWQWTADAYEAAGSAGIFGPDPRVELIGGEVYRKMTISPGHASTVTKLGDALAGVDRRRWAVRAQNPVRLDDLSEPEPDLAVVAGPADRYDHRHPGPEETILVVEVSDASLRMDRDIKLPRYAAAGVPEVWVISLAARTLTRCTDPVDGRYQSVETITSGQVAVAGVTVELEAILPKP